VDFSVEISQSAIERAFQLLVQSGTPEDIPNRLQKVEQQIELLRNLLQDAGSVVTYIGLFALFVSFVSLTAFVRDWIYNYLDRKATATTVKLVDDLLSVAERATRQATDAQLNYVMGQVKQIGDKCDQLLDATRDDDRSIVTLSKHRAAAREYGQTIAVLEPQIQFHLSANKQPSLTDQGKNSGLPASCLCCWEICI
jgi:hypothetical protein